jgi:hypothetical protein
VKIDPITTNKPTNADLARGFNQLHACHEDSKDKIETIQQALGLTAGQKKVSGLSTPFKAWFRSVLAVMTGLGGVVMAYRVAVALWPGTWAFLLNLNHVILTGKF